MKLKDRTALVTGGGSGIGRAIALLFAGEGARVIVNDVLLSGRGIQTHWDVTQSTSDESWCRMLSIHLDGTFFCTREALRQQVPHDSAAKAGILGFTRAVAREVGSRGIRTVSRTPPGRWAEPQEVATTALFLAFDDSSFFTGQWLSPNGGLFIG